MSVMTNLWNRIFNFLGNHGDTTPNKAGQVFIGKDIGADQQLSDVEISFLRLLEGKSADDPTVLGWWSALRTLTAVNNQ